MNKETTEQGRGYQSPYHSEITYKSDKGFLVRLKAMIERIMRDASYKTYGERFDNFISRFDDAEDYLFESRESTPSPANTSEQERLWHEVKEVFMKHYDAYNYPSQAISELLTTYKISKK